MIVHLDLQRIQLYSYFTDLIATKLRHRSLTQVSNSLERFNSAILMAVVFETLCESQLAISIK